MKIVYQTTLKNIDAEMLNGFFVDWPNPPSNTILLKTLNQSAYIVLALDDNKVVGFINAISDKVLSAYIPLLEVLTEYQGKGIGKQLVLEMEKQIQHLYMQDIICDKNIVPFYEKLGYFKINGMIKRNYKVLKKHT